MNRERFLWSWFGLVVLATLVIVGNGGWTPPRNDPAGLTYAGVWMAPGVFTGLGVVIATRQPGNRISRLFLFVGLSLLFSVWADLNVSLVAPEPVSTYDAVAVILFNTWFIIGLMVPVLLLMFLFPTGTFLTRRWSWAGWAAGVAVATAFFAESFVDPLSPQFGPDLDAWTIPNPIGLLETGTMENPPYVFILGASVLSLAFGGVAALVVRYKRSSGLVRAQIRWVVFALCLFAGVALISSILGNYGLGLVISMMLIPVSVALAVSRYKLFEIDRLIARTVSYAIVVGLLFGAGVGAVTLLARTMPVQSDLAVVGATLAVVALFAPVRRRIQTVVDRRFNRTRYVADQEMAAFAHRVRDTTDLAVIEEDVRSVIDRTMQPVSTNIWFGSDGE